MEPAPRVRKSAGDVYDIYVGGQWIAASSGGVHTSVDPADPARILGRVPEASAEEVARAVSAAQRDFDAWRLLPADFRTKVFFRLTELLRSHADLLVRAMTQEMGKTHRDSRLDIDEAIGVCETLAPQGTNFKGMAYPKIARGLAMECRPAPRGVAAIITPFNFPVAIPVAQIVAALITGNTVVWKPSHLTPASSQLLADLVLQALESESRRLRQPLPRGVFHLVFGDAAAGSALVREESVQTISFTGSRRVGDQVSSQASLQGKKVLKEVAGINFFYVHREADLDRAARNFIYGKTITGGQRCSSIQELLVDRDVEEELRRRVLALCPGIVQGPGGSEELAAAEAQPDRWACPPIASREQLDRLTKLVESAIAAGGRIIYRAELDPRLAGRGYHYPFTILGGIGPGNPLHVEEAFGPVAVWNAVDGIDEAIARINDSVGIVACIDSRDKSATENFIERVLRTRIDDGRHGTGCFWGTKFGGDRGAGSGNAALDEDMVQGYVIWKTIYRAYEELPVR